MKKSILFLVVLSLIFILSCAPPEEKPETNTAGEAVRTNPDRTIDLPSPVIKSYGLGNLCSSEEECHDFCLNNMGRCRDYCSKNQGNPLCFSIYPGEEQDPETSPPVVRWFFVDGIWKYNGNPPPCPEPLVLQTPVDLAQVTAILYPGQYRGDYYKPHGGFRLDGTPNDKVTVRAPMGGYVLQGSRTIDDGEMQYSFDFVNECGIMHRFGHLLILTPKFAEIAETFPLRVEDTRTTMVNTLIYVSAGEEIATGVGFAKTNNVGFDWGVYDLRHENEASKNPEWLQEHGDPGDAFRRYALCWFDLLPPEDATKVRELPGADWKSGKTSDYC